MTAPLGWLAILRLGLVQAGLGAVVVLTTATFNRVMVVELALPAVLPGALVALHYAVQVLRPRLGYGSDRTGRRTPWIVGGMAVLAAGGIAAALATALMETRLTAGIALALLAFIAIGLGVGAAGTSLLALLARHVAPDRRGPAATIVWLMMIAGIAITASVTGRLLDPFSLTRLVTVTAVVCGAAFLLSLLAVWGIESPTAAASADAARTSFREALLEAWAEPEARRFTVFVFVSMLAYSAQDLILEPFAGLIFGLTPGQSTSLSGLQHGGVLVGMLLVALGARLASLRTWTVGGCIASAAALSSLVAAGVVGPSWPLQASVLALGVANGAFAVAAIGSMMALAGRGREAREGTRMGMWGAAQAVAFGLGGFTGTVAADLARQLYESPAAAYATVFAGEAALFLVAAMLAARIGGTARREKATTAGAPCPAGLAGS
jgi:BCD family chlorophyll transporter-like MFS transporter